MSSNFPDRFVERIKQILPADQWDQFFESCTEPLPKIVRKTKPLETPQGWTLKPTDIEEAFFIDRLDQKERALGKTLEHFSGQIYSQSLSSMLPVKVLAPASGEKIIDLCAAPGSKTSFISQKMDNTGLVVANEPSGSRSKKLAANLDRMGSINNVVVQSDGTILCNFLGQEFDKVLLDAPCSSEGYGRRDNQFFTKMWSEKKIFQAAKLQRRLILSAFEMLSPGGVMVYSTCTSAPEENESVVQYLIDTYGEALSIEPLNLEDTPSLPGLTHWEGEDFEADISEHARRFYPHLRSDTWNSESFFVVKIRKHFALKIPPPQKPARLAEIKVFKKNQTAELVTKIAKTYGLPKSWPEIFGSEKPVFIEKQGVTYLATQQASRFISQNLFRRIGLAILDKDQNLTTEFALKIASKATKNVIDLDKDQTQKWLEGFDIPLDFEADFTHKNVLVAHKNFGLGWGKHLQGKLKNKLDRDLIN